VKTWLHLGNGTPDYRSIMAAHHDFYIGDKLIPASRVVICQQTHSREVHICSEADSGAGFGAHPQIPVADGFVTNVPHQYLLIRTADCTPVLFADKLHRAVGAVHSGREGTRKNICGKAVSQMLEHYQCLPENITAYIGAGICAAHYEVSPEIWEEYQNTLHERGVNCSDMAYRHPDVKLTIYRQLRNAGLDPDKIHVCPDCTYESDKYFSYRKDGSHNRQINIAGIIL